ncbi:RNA polymerase sigma factor [Stackebrandtia nassauensis]|uniref:RNA polymerase, sigma-24 subunit, ECF subfamily n=1 Tax=Stackebrandtia nassauensis (strain DSM 44728 / CIP 108903 / NRRL B-16338 / NBRC 102104 / LLR-40K-21) TaxID=446470 RepID=D3Q073_STANL|nr:SigE family RNA polymerase sigma factor [Stackebrandtia nassauensis]ADD45602.1 RNA polymerase, sigma-24 subunit, ECF subfamily [Stackebrandtia nassauensis DSM 44728]
MRPEHKTAYREFVAANLDRMCRFAYLTCGDWHRGEDAVQTAFVKLYAAWPRVVRTDRLESYTRRIVTNVLIDQYRRGWFRREKVAEAVPDSPQESDGTDRVAVLRALQRLPVRQRATLVWRYWEDQSVAETARIMRCSENTVKTQTARGLRTLRGLLTESINESFEGSHA